MKKLVSLLVTAFVLTLSILPTAYAQASLAAVENFKVDKTGNQSVTLKWDPVSQATGYTLLYGTSAVTQADQEYNRPPIVLGNVTNHTVTGLTNGTTYYFNIFATNNTATSLSLTDEVNAKPSAEGANAAPVISSVQVLNNKEFKLVFSKAMTFPANPASQVTIVKGFDETPLKVVSAQAEGTTTLKVTTDPQSQGAEYRLTLTDQFKDQAGTAIPVSERQDVFVGGAENAFADLLASADENAGELKIESALVGPDAKAVELTFSKPVVLEENARSQFAIVETESPADSSLTIKEVIANQQDAKKVLVVVDEFKPVSYTLLALRVKDTTGQLIAEANSTIEFSGAPDSEGSSTSGSEVSDLQARFIDVAKLLAQVTWASNPELNLQGFKVYLQEGTNGTYNLLGDLGADASEFNTEALNPADLYKFKVTSLDANGVESEGAVAELVLPGTGPAGLAMLAFGSLGLGRFFTRRKD